MKTSSRFGILAGILLSISLSSSAFSSENDTQTRRLAHAKELLGSGYGRSVVSDSEDVGNLNDFIIKRIHSELKRKWKSKYREIAEAILHESSVNQFDPIFLMAVIENESSFNPDTRGSHGEIGLLQIIPKTGRWIAKKSGIEWHGSKTLKNPVLNIKIGAAYLSFLRERFDSQGRLYLSAYNMGTTNVNRALGRDIRPKTYAFHVMKRYIAFYRALSDQERAASGSCLGSLECD